MGCRDPAEIEALPARVVNGWRAFYNLEPFGPMRDNFHAAQIAAILANAHRDPKRPAFGVVDFFWQDAESARAKREASAVQWFDSISERKH